MEEMSRVLNNNQKRNQKTKEDIKSEIKQYCAISFYRHLIISFPNDFCRFQPKPIFVYFKCILGSTLRRPRY